MAIEVVWDDDAQTIMRYIYGEHWEWQELDALAVELNARYGDLPQVVDFIIDMRRSRSVPKVPGGDLLRRAMQDHQPKPANTGIYVLINGPKLFRMVWNVGRRVYPKMAQYYYFVDTLEEAYAVVARAKAQRAQPQRQESVG